MQYDLYHFKQDLDGTPIILEFKFEKGPNNLKQKRAFLDLLREADETLSRELITQ